MEYRVLARKYRPASFDDLIGQDVLVRTLSNAIASGRIAHAFLLTGIRGVGKTTTARIIARALNCIGEDGKSGPTIAPCGVCSHCLSIAQDRHVDVLEMDAASHTGVGDIRELIDTVRYLPNSARYKIYIIDEVHMLSNSAFNALLKTLEEPPPHVKFIFATTESRKIPVTILSRCQRFDLKRIPMDVLASHIQNVASKEQASIDPEAALLIATAAEGSVRDSLSLLDQAIARAMETPGEANISASAVRQMLGSADNSATFSLIETLLAGDITAALAQLKQHYHDGADPLQIVQDCLDATHLVTRMKVAASASDDISLSESDRQRAQAIAQQAPMPVLTRLWQMWLKGLQEVRVAPSALSALEMLLVRIAYAAQLPTPGEVVRGSGNDAPAATSVKPTAPAAPKASLELVLAKEPAPSAVSQVAQAVSVSDFPAVVALFAQQREALLHSWLKQEVRLVAFEQGKIELNVPASLPRDFCARVADVLTRATGQPWKVLPSTQPGFATLEEQEAERARQKVENASAHPLVASVLEQFPGAKVVGVKTNA